MNPEFLLKESIAKGLEKEFSIIVAPESILLEPTRKDFEGSLTFVVFPYIKQAKLSPEQIGARIGEFCKTDIPNIIASVNVVKGFLNIVFKDSLWVDQLYTNFLREDFAQVTDGKGEKVMVEYSSPNTNKPLHLGHLRNNFLGYSISQILKANGFDVVKANLVNDRGIHICKSMLAYQKFGSGETPQSAGMKGDHLVGKYYVAFDKELKKEIESLVASGIAEEQAKKDAPILKEAQAMLLKWEQGDKEVYQLWETMNAWVYEGFNESYKNIGVSFDHFYYESNTYLLGKDIVEEGLQMGVFNKREDGSVWIDLTAEGLDQKLVLRSDGTSVYITQDLGTAELKFKDFGCKRSVYVVGNEQDYHFVVLAQILKKLNKPYADGLYHMSYGMVDLPSGKMKSREGTVVDADDLVSEMVETAKLRTLEQGKTDGFTGEQAQKLYHTIGLGALKYYLLKVDPKKRMMFNPEESIDFQGHTGPSIQYTYARISAILRKAAELGITSDLPKGETIETLNPFEISVLELLSRFPTKIREAGAEYSPSTIANYIFEVAKEFNRFYVEVSIFQETDEIKKSFRIAFCKAVAKTIKDGMLLLGIEVPEKM
ncbi:arginine--tRNA ligase [uncultured Cytophaga sp.]|uniref:arginine--tRNA ligase n=1 Tax=uncultured Cytophaga sp. TaxID=160238 RepID=UPI002619DE81|nr:arginine--tRNA ligase [uncultured Cytophaga sp.]